MTEIKRMDHITAVEPLAAALTATYRTVFDEIDTLAAQRHLMTVPECEAVWANHHVQKWIAFEGTAPVGLSVITNDLHAWPLISPRFFERIEPERYRFRKIWYVGFVGVLPGHSGTFVDLIREMSGQVIDGDGMAVMDFAHYNVAVRKLDKVTQRILRRIDPRAAHILLDRQEFHGWLFPDAV